MGPGARMLLRVPQRWRPGGAQGGLATSAPVRSLCSWPPVQLPAASYGHARCVLACMCAHSLLVATCPSSASLQGLRDAAAGEPVPVLRPTKEEFGNCMEYIIRNYELGVAHGIVKIVPPEGWSPACALNPDIVTGQRFYTRMQRLRYLHAGEPYPDGNAYTLSEFRVMADRYLHKFFPHLLEDDESVEDGAALLGFDSAEQALAAGHSRAECVAALAERDYWAIVDAQDLDISVEYGNDLDTVSYCSGFQLRKAAQNARGQVRVGVGNKTRKGSYRSEHYAVQGNKSGTPAVHPRAAGLRDAEPVKFRDQNYYARTGWNLVNWPHVPSCITRLIPDDIAGINVPWLYVGMLFSTFAWHVEDNYLFSVNYMHAGAGKLWYGVPSHEADAMERAIQEAHPAAFAKTADVLHHVTLMMSPAALAERGIKVRRTVQHAGEFIVTYPRSFHAGFSLGFNVGEACNFASSHWLSWGRLALENYRVLPVPRSSVTCLDKLVVDLAGYTVAARTPEDITAALQTASELRRTVLGEITARALLLTAWDGVYGKSPSPRMVVVDRDDDPRGDCNACRRICYLSAVVCYHCKSGSMACLAHSTADCTCVPGQAGRLISAWRSDAQLLQLLKDLQELIRGSGMEKMFPLDARAEEAAEQAWLAALARSQAKLAHAVFATISSAPVGTTAPGMSAQTARDEIMAVAMPAAVWPGNADLVRHIQTGRADPGQAAGAMVPTTGTAVEGTPSP